MGTWFRHPRTTQERRLNDDPELGRLARARRCGYNLPDAYDDIDYARRGKTWKRFRRVPYRGTDRDSPPADLLGGKGVQGGLCTPRRRKHATEHRPARTHRDSRKYAEHASRRTPCNGRFYRRMDFPGFFSPNRRQQTQTLPRLAYTWDARNGLTPVTY